MKGIKEFFKKNKTIVIIFLGITIVIGIVYYYFVDTRKCFDGISVVFSIPSVFLSLAVLNLVNISRDNLDSYYQKRKLREEDYKNKQKDIKEVFDETLGDIRQTVQIYSKYTKRVYSGEEVNNTMRNQCIKELEDIKMFFDHTKSFILLYVNNTIGDSGDVDRIDYIDVKNIIISENEIYKIGDEINKLNSDYFNKEVDINNKQTLEYLFFDEDKGFRKYLNFCQNIYSSIGGCGNE